MNMKNRRQFMTIFFVVSLAFLASSSAWAAGGIPNVEIEGKTYTNIERVYVGPSEHIIIVHAGGVTSATADKVPTNFLASWNILADLQRMTDQAIASGAFREIDGVVYDTRKPESKWVTFAKAKVIQVTEDGAILDTTPDATSYLSVHVRHLPNTIGDTDTIRFSARLVGSYSYINKKNDDRTIRDYDAGVICSRDKIPESVVSGQKAFDTVASVGAVHKDIIASLPESEHLKASGTGFFITDDGYFISNNHVVKGATKIRIITRSGPLIAKVIQVDESTDLALLKVEGKFTPLPITSSRTAHLGASVVTIGFPEIDTQGFAPKFAKGEIASLSGIQDDPKYFQISVPVQHGNSGGALVDQHGNVVGVVAAKLGMAIREARSSAELPENVNYAVKSSFLLSFLESEPQVAAKLKEPITVDKDIDDVIKSAENAAALVLVY
jgi:S1-C subfamily serine protease